MALSSVGARYCRSANCRMEFQFTVKSLNKPLVVLIVGDAAADEWKTSAVGMLLQVQPALFNTWCQHYLAPTLLNVRC